MEADFVLFTETGQLAVAQNRQLPCAIIIGIILSPDYIYRISNSDLKLADEFNDTERKTDQLADHIAFYLNEKGYAAFSQSEKNLVANGCYDEQTKSSALPHKTIAGLAGLGWIGKQNLLVSQEFGSALSLCTVLTDAPLQTVKYAPASPQCEDCSICVDNCQSGAISGNQWRLEGTRDELVDVHRCTSCLKCLALCPWTQNFMKRHMAV